MYEDTIKVANKIISDTDLLDIFQKMNEELTNCLKISAQEEETNKRYEREYQTWTCKNCSTTFKCDFNFYDDTNITVDNYNHFIGIFNGRLHEIKSMWIRCYVSYSKGIGFKTDSISQHINLNIHEHKMSIEASISSQDDKLNGVYELIKQKILTAPERYDRIIKKKNFIINKVSFAIGLIPSLVICSLLAIIPVVREYYAKTYLLFPLASIILGYVIGTSFSGGKLHRLYSTIVPKQKYAGYDSDKHQSIYKDDMDDYLNTSEIIIGKNIDNIEHRKEIDNIEKKYSKLIPKELIAVLILSTIVIIIGKVL